MDEVTAIEIAERFGLDPKRLRQALRDKDLPWHRVSHARWIALRGSSEEADMIRVASKLTGR